MTFSHNAFGQETFFQKWSFGHKTFVKKTFCQNTFGHKKFDKKSFGLITFPLKAPEDIWLVDVVKRHWVNRRGQKTFGQKHKVKRHLVKIIWSKEI